MKRLMVGLAALMMTSAAMQPAHAGGVEKVKVDKQNKCWVSKGTVSAITGVIDGGHYLFVRQFEDNSDIGGNMEFPVAGFPSLRLIDTPGKFAMQNIGKAESGDEAGDFDLFKAADNVKYRIDFVDADNKPSEAKVNVCIRDRPTL